MGSPSNDYKIIHVAGTNGKGTVSLNIAKGLQKAGYKVGVYSSPHYVTYHERISVNGNNISEEKLQELYTECQHLLDGLMFFEYMTLLALLYFSREKVDYAVIEAGVGGLKDTTNIIMPILSVITNISNDHAEYLGGTIDSIAYNKAGIIKEGIPVVLGYHARHERCLIAAKEKHAKVFAVKEEKGDYLQENKVIADKALEVLGVTPAKETFTPPARFEVHGKYIFDMAHNEAAFKALGRKIAELYPGKKVIAVWNMGIAKDARPCLKILQSFVDTVYFFPSKNFLLLPEEKAKELSLSVYNGETADVILVCGSIYFLAEAKETLISSFRGS